MNRHNRAIFLDRDGVVNQAVVRNGKPFSPASWNEIKIPADVPSSLQRLKEAGFLLIVITNQPDVARGRQTKEAVEEIHSGLRSRLPLDDIFACYHDEVDRCDCRKPKPGMLLDASGKYSIDLSSSFVIGDRDKDIEAGRIAGCKTIFLDAGYDQEKSLMPADLTVSSLEEAVPWILENSKDSGR